MLCTKLNVSFRAPAMRLERSRLMTVVFVATLVQSSRGSNDGGKKRPLTSVHIVLISLMFSSRSPVSSFVHGHRESPEMERHTTKRLTTMTEDRHADDERSRREHRNGRSIPTSVPLEGWTNLVTNVTRMKQIVAGAHARIAGRSISTITETWRSWRRLNQPS